MLWDESRGIALDPFVGVGGSLSRGVYYVLKLKQPLSTRQIYKSVVSIPYFKDTLLSTINKKVRKLEERGYLKKTQINQKIGGSTNYYELTTKFDNRWILDSNTKKELFENKNEEIEQILNSVLKKALQDK